jgi:hypothetical protein
MGELDGEHGIRGGRRRRAALLMVSVASLSPFLVGVVSADAEQLELPVDEEVVVEEVPDGIADAVTPLVAPDTPTETETETETETVEAEPEPSTGTAPAAPVEPQVVTITPSGDSPMVDVADAGPIVTVTPATEVTEADAEVTVTAAPGGPDLLEVLIATEEPTSTPVPPMTITIAEPGAGLDRPVATFDIDAQGVVRGVTVIPAADGPPVLELHLWDSADALSAPLVEVGDAGSSEIRITLPTGAVPAPVAFTSPAQGEHQPTVKLRALGRSGDILQVTLVPLPLPALGNDAEDGLLPDPDLPLPGDAPVTDTPPELAPPTTVAPSPAPAPAAPARATAQPAPAPTTTAPAPSSAPAAPAPALAAPPLANDNPRPLLELPESAPQVVTDLGRRSVDAARRFPIPTGLAIAVAIFLLVQGRIDRRDPRLAAAAADDELLGFG